MLFPHSTGKRLAARRLCRTNTQLRRPRFTHLGERVKVIAPLGCLSSLFHSGRGLSPSAVRARRCATTPRHGMSKRAAHLHGACCARGHVSWCRGTTRAVRSCNLVDIVPSIHVRLRTHNTNFHSDPLSSSPSRTVPAFRPATRLPQKHKPHQHGLRRESWHRIRVRVLQGIL